MTKIATTPANGGETHQGAGGEDAVLTTNRGVPISDNQNSLKSGARGPTLPEDFVLREKIFHFDHERIPERIVYARGFGAHGLFEATDDISDLSSATVFSKGEKTGVAIILSDEGGQALLKEGAAVEFAMNAFAHFEAIGVNKGAQPLLDKAGVEPDEGVTGLDGAFIKAAARCFYDREPKLRTLA